MDDAVKIAKWGNSQGVRIPAKILREAELEMNDLLYIESDTRGRIILSKKPSPKRGTIEYLFKDYTGKPFKTELIDLGDAVGEEKW